MVSTNTNYFALLPNEIIMLIYQYIPDHFPILRKLDRRWRELLEHEYRPECDYVKLLMPTYGYKYNRGVISIRDICREVAARLFSALLYMEYTWIYKVNESRYIRDMYYFLIGYAAPGVNLMFEESLFIHIMSRCADRDTNILRIIAKTNNANMTRQIHALGFGYNESTITGAENLSVLKALHEIGCPWHSETLKCIIYAWGCTGVIEVENELYEMFRYAIKNGCEINDDDVAAAINTPWFRALREIYKTGYVIKDDLLTNPTVKQWVRYWTRKYKK